MKEKFENVPQEQPEEEIEAMPDKEKLEVILKLFGNTVARNAFLETCKKYVALRGAAMPDSYGENYIPKSGRTYSPPKRAILHNQIMETLQRLSLQKLDPLSEKILFEMADREVAGKIIKAWVLAHEAPHNQAKDDDNDEEDEHRKGRGDMSDTAYFHSLGRET